MIVTGESRSTERKTNFTQIAFQEIQLVPLSEHTPLSDRQTDRQTV